MTYGNLANLVKNSEETGLAERQITGDFFDPTAELKALTLNPIAPLIKN
jgi:hypothetical protein